jgi:hypothetical protein
MSKVAVAALAVALGMVIGVGGAVAQDRETSKGMAAVERATKTGKYAFIFFYSEQGEQTASMRQIFRSAVAKVSKSAARVEVNVADAAEAAIVNRYGVGGAPMPFVLAVAPNGAVTGGFPAPFDEKQIVDAFATPCTQASLKALQEGKVVLLCIQNGGTTLNAAAMKGVQDFKADPKYTASTEIITLDPSDSAEAKLLGLLAVDPKINQALTVCLVPPGQTAAKLSGATTKEMIAGSLKSGGGGCCAGGAKSCGPAASGQGTSAPTGTTAGTKTQSGQGSATPGTGK